MALICSYNALVLGVRLSHARYSSDVNTLGDDGILPDIPINRILNFMFKILELTRYLNFKLTSIASNGR